MSTLVVDDHEGLVESMRDFASRSGILDAVFATSVEQARRLTKNKPFKRYVADFNFEGEQQTGADFLEEVRSAQPDAKLYLLTGRNLDHATLRRLAKINAALVKKVAFGREVLGALLRGQSLSAPVLQASDGEVDVAQQRLIVEAAEEALSREQAMNMLLLEDVIASLRRAGLEGEQGICVGDRLLSPHDLEQEVSSRTELGREIVRLHVSLNQKLRERKSFIHFRWWGGYANA